MKKIIFLLIISLYFSSSLSISAQHNQSQENSKSQTQSQQINQNAELNREQQQEQNRIQTQNASEESQLRIKNQDKNNQPPSIEDQTKLIGEKITNLIGDKEASGEVSDQIGNFFDKNKNLQNDVQEQLKILQSKQGIIRKLFGADQRIIDNLDQQIQIN